MQIGFRFPGPVGQLSLAVRRNIGADAFVFSEVFQHRCYDVELVRSPDTILDLGANIGFASIFFSRMYPKASIACVEPVSSNVDVLSINLSSNGAQVTILPVAIGVSDGRLDMSTDERDYGHKVAGITFGRAVDGRRFTVESLSVPTIMQRLHWSRIGLLKVDIEGYEAILLTTDCDWLHLVDSILVECHEGFDEADLNRVALAHGFAVPRQLAGGVWLVQRTLLPAER